MIELIKSILSGKQDGGIVPQEYIIRKYEKDFYDGCTYAISRHALRYCNKYQN